MSRQVAAILIIGGKLKSNQVISILHVKNWRDPIIIFQVIALTRRFLNL